MLQSWMGVFARLRKIEKAFCVLLVLYLILLVASPGGVLPPLTQIALVLLGALIALRFTLVGMRKAIWRLRNRLLVTYLFIAVVPVFLIITLAGLGGYALIRQVAVYLAVSDLDRRANMLRDLADSLTATEPQLRPELMRQVRDIHRQRFPNLAFIARYPGKLQAWPPDEPPVLPPDGWKPTTGVAVRKGRYYLWSHARRGTTEVTLAMPLSRAYLSNMVPGLGDVSLLDLSDPSQMKTVHEPPSGRLPEAYNRFDFALPWFSTIPVWKWDSPGQKQSTLLFINTRPSAVLRTIFDARIDQIGDFVPALLLGVAILFLIVELIALIIGTSLSRTITRAVHSLYAGTQRVIEGDFSHRIHVFGKDQLAELSASFNAMTGNLEQLLKVAKEKERLQAELEIARQVQQQLFPKVIPSLRTLSLTAVCEPARMVSGDYYDYLCIPDGRLAIAMADVAGKGISAALLMATIQAAMRMELRTSRAVAAPGNSPEILSLPTSRLVSDLNQQLHATTSPEKFATFFFALYNENTGMLKYTNAGHLPPLLVRGGSAVRLEASGTVVGAFPFAEYQDDQVQMQSGDLLVCYTDGITEPENEYGEEFGEERLIDLITRNAEREDAKIVSLVLDAVHQWTSAEEQPDDMTLLLARRI